MAGKSEDLTSKYRRLQEILREMRRVLVAFSGGVDSTLLLKVAKDVLGDEVLAVTADSATTAGHERQDASRHAADLKAEHLVVSSRELDLPGFISNPKDKCYVCKMSRFGDLMSIASKRGFPYVVDGENLDDEHDFRPGSRAARELGVRSPLREAGLSKPDVRRLSKKLGLPTWNRPAYACLASRIPYGSPITLEKLGQIDAGEEYLRALVSSGQVRVRHYGDTARIEVEPARMAKFIRNPTRSEVLDFFRSLGFTFVTLDLAGYRMGSLNQALRGAESRNGPKARNMRKS